MAGIGAQNEALGTRLTARRTLRAVAAPDASVDDVQEVLDATKAENDRATVRGDHATLVLYAVLDGPSVATIKLFGRASPDASEESSSSSSSSESPNDEWALYDSYDITVDNRMIVLPDMVASEYKVVVSAITGEGSVIVREQHST